MHNPQKLLIDSASRLGKPRHGKSRPIVVSFILQQEYSLVKNMAIHLKGTRFSIRDHHPEEVEVTRRKLYPIEREARRLGRRTKLVKDRLYIDGELFSIQELDKAATTSETSVHGPNRLQYLDVDENNNGDDDNRGSADKDQIATDVNQEGMDTEEGGKDVMDDTIVAIDMVEPEKPASPVDRIKARVMAVIDRKNGKKGSKSQPTSSTPPVVRKSTPVITLGKNLTQTSLFPEVRTLNSPSVIQTTANK